MAAWLLLLFWISDKLMGLVFRQGVVHNQLGYHKLHTDLGMHPPPYYNGQMQQLIFE
jgi:hypothetical protein